ncbi:MAG: hypothetical protein IT225_00520 [Flavobacteriales bacterium]|nr:hypothetical protein [Flavobacteriales bacterium]
MRSLLQRHRWITYMVVGLFLVATNGMTISRMTCLEGGHSVLSLGVSTGCCPDEGEPSDTPTFKASCCELALVKGERDNILPNIGINHHIDTIDLWLHVTQVSPPATVRSIPWLASRPPPRSAPDRLSVISVQRV